MEKAKKIKLFIGLFYLLVVCTILYFIFSNYTFQEITSYEFIKNNRIFFFELRQSNFFMLASLYIFLTILWTFAAGIGFPVGLLAGFIFGTWFGVLFCVVGQTIGATFLYIFANYFLKDIIKEKFLIHFKNLKLRFNKSEFNFLLIYRFIGGIPFAISNVLPCMFNVKKSNFFFATLIGIIPQNFLITSIGSGLEKIVVQNIKPPTFMDIIKSPDIYIPLLVFFGFVVTTIIIRKKIYPK